MSVATSAIDIDIVNVRDVWHSASSSLSTSSDSQSDSGFSQHSRASSATSNNNSNSAGNTAPTSKIASEIIDGLSKPTGQKELPTLLLYDELGLQLYDDITTKASDYYYLFGAEEEILKSHADEIVRTMHATDRVVANGGKSDQHVVQDEVVLELGAGALRKTSHILLGLSRLVEDPIPESPPITYYALDLEQNELVRTLSEIAMSDIGKSLAGRVDTKGMCATYEEGLKFVDEGGLKGHSGSTRARSSSTGNNSTRDHSPVTSEDATDSALDSPAETGSAHLDPSVAGPPLHILFLGSSLGNFPREAGREFLRSLPLRPGSGDTLLLGLDHNNGKGVIEEAYNDPKGYTRRFIMNGLRAAGRTLGDETMFGEDKWEYVNNYNEKERRHEAYYRSKCDQSLEDPNTHQTMSFLEDELLKIEVSYKYSDEDAYALFSSAGLRPVQRWTDSGSQYSLWLLERPQFSFPLLSSPLACNRFGLPVQKVTYSTTPFGVPSPQEWENLWTAWDFVTLKMIPPNMLFQKPIDLRHICLFYIGHIPTFLDIYLSRLFDEPHTEPVYFKDIFERGIDPNIDDPTICHSHSIVPQEDEDWPTIDTLLEFRTRVRARLLKVYEDFDAGKITLNRKIGRVLFMTFEHEALHLETLLYMLLQRAGNGTIPPTGFIKPAWPSLADTWNMQALAFKARPQTVTLGPAVVSLGHDDIEADDEKPDKALKVKDHEFGWDNESPRRDVNVGEFKIEWRPVTNGQFYEFWKAEQGTGKKGRVAFPDSWVEVGGEIMVRTFYGPVPMKTANEWPVLTSYNNLSVYAVVKGGRLPTEAELRLFLDKFESGYEGGSNYGFRNWHPIPATTGGERNGGRGGNGGVWEWTSTTLQKHEGFEPSPLYPGYTADFFDDTHNVVLGGSYATIPRIAGRRSVRNWYQRKYGYAWVGGRVAYDV